jgi:PIN domain
MECERTSFSNMTLRKQQKPQLLVVFDTNALFTGSASDLIKQEAANLIKESTFGDLEIRWYLPEMVRHERQYQMQKKALELLPPIAKVERLLGHNLAITEQTLIESVEKVVSQRLEEHRLLILTQDYKKVDWHTVALDAAYRKPPFQEGEAEKGFRDRMIVECFLQLVDASPKTPAICRIVLVSGDRLVAQAVADRTTGLTNTRVLAALDELKGLINTLVSQVDEGFLATLKPKAKKMFFMPKEQSSLFYKMNIREKLTEAFAKELSALPPGATARTDGAWIISEPEFVQKAGSRIQWTSRIEIRTEASRVSYRIPPIDPTIVSKAAPGNQLATDSLLYTQIPNLLGSQTLNLAAPGQWVNMANTRIDLGNYGMSLEAGNAITTHRGVDVYEILWSADVTTKGELRRPSIEEIRHGELSWEQVA